MGLVSYSGGPVYADLFPLRLTFNCLFIYKGFLRDVKDGRIYQGASGLTNTLRLQHTGIVNLPATSKLYAQNVRKCFKTVDDEHILVGCDLSGVEDNTKRHYIYQYDKEYVESMNTPGHDPHLELAVLAGFLTKEQGEEHKLYEKTKKLHEENPLIPIEGKSHKEIRQKAKTANFALTYKTGLETLMRTTGLNRKDAQKLKDTYWKRNKAILDVENSLKIKQIGEQKWLLNPVSKFWYSLRSDKDKFSTLNQGTAVFVFDTWLKYLRQKRTKISFQVHDEWTSEIYKEFQEFTKNKVLECIDLVNQELKLNVVIGCSIDFGQNYAECH